MPAAVPSCGIYVIECLLTSKHYVGQSLHVGRRLREHVRILQAGNHANPYLQFAWVKHGLENFRCRQVLACSPGDLTLYEQIVADSLREHGLYNIGEFTDAPNRGRKFSEAVKKKQSDSHRTLFNDPAFKKAHVARVRAATGTDEYRAAMSNNLKRRWADPAFRAKLEESGYLERLSALGVERASSKEWRERCRASAFRQWEDEDRRERQSQTLRRVLSAPEHGERIRTNNAKMWADEKHRANISAQAAVRNADPKFKSKFLAAVNRGWDNPERRAQASARMKAMRARQAAARTGEASRAL